MPVSKKPRKKIGIVAGTAMAVATALTEISPIFGRSNSEVTNISAAERAEKKRRNKIQYMKSQARRFGTKNYSQESSRRKSQYINGVIGGQYPEFAALEAKNINSGKWALPL